MNLPCIISALNVLVELDKLYDTFFNLHMNKENIMTHLKHRHDEVKTPTDTHETLFEHRRTAFCVNMGTQLRHFQWQTYETSSVGCCGCNDSIRQSSCCLSPSQSPRCRSWLLSEASAHLTMEGCSAGRESDSQISSPEIVWTVLRGLWWVQCKQHFLQH